MAEYAPQALWDCFHTVAAYVFTAEMSGIIGDSGHTYGYHRGRNYISSGDYSVADYPADRQGSGEAANGLDISFGSSDMQLVTQRLIDAVDRGDPRIQVVRSFYGTTDGYNVTGREVPTGEWVTSDDSHLWHVHVSGFREHSENHDAWQGVASIMIGQQEVEDLDATQSHQLENVYYGMFAGGPSMPQGGKSLNSMIGEIYGLLFKENKEAPGKRSVASTEANNYAALLTGGSSMPQGKSVAQLLGELTVTVNALAEAAGVSTASSTPPPAGKHVREQ